MFGTDSDWWLRDGVRRGKYPHLRVGRRIRFTDEHVAEIRAMHEKRGRRAPIINAVDVSVFNPSSRSFKRRR